MMMLMPLTICLVFGLMAVMQERPWIAAGLGLLVTLFGGTMLSPLIILCGLAIAVAGGIGVRITPHRGKRAALVAIVLALCWSPFITGAVSRYRLVERLRPQFPYVSLEERVRATAEPFVTESHDPSFDAGAIEYRSWSRGSGRIRAIAALHRSATSHFLNAPEFGFARMSNPRLQQLEEATREPILLSELEGDLASATLTPPEQLALALSDAEFRNRVGAGHRKVARWFVSPDSTGHVKDVRQVAGFQPHGIHQGSFARYVPSKSVDHIRDAFVPTRPADDDLNSGPDFRLVNLQLVGLLYHDTPVVYDMESLPDSATATTAPTRPLDEFESDALGKLQEGEAFVFDQRSHQIRVFGGLWNAESCQQCHEGSDNQLLGAFSYTLVATNSDS